MIFISDMLKRIPKSDISIRPFKAYKEWSFDQDSTEIDILLASDVSSSYSTDNNLSFQQTAIYAQLKAQFYNGNENNPFTRVGAASLVYNSVELTKDRFLSGSAKVVSIPQKYIGEGIKKGSVVLTNGDFTYGDDNYGNLISLAGDTLSVGYLGIPVDNVASLGYLYFSDIANTVYSASVIDWDGQTGIIDLVYDSINYDGLQVLSFNLDNGSMVIDNVPFLIGAGGTNRIGNVFYNQGIFALTRGSESYLTGSWDLRYKSTQTIYENEYLLIANQDEFNVSQNPSAIHIVGQETSSFADTSGRNIKVISNPGVKYIKKLTTLENGNVLDYRYTSSVNTDINAGFEHYDLSGSVDSTGSFLAPFITTIGLYDDEMDLVAVAKLPQPIKSEPDIPVNFIVRFDT
jgi:hypothetical protein